MRILLVGEYSGLHNALKAGLVELGHEVLLVGTGDGFKNYPVDHDHGAKLFASSFIKPFVKLIHKLSSINLIQLENGLRFKKLLPQLRDYDVVQLINENSIKSNPYQEIKILKTLMEQNNKLFLLSCGTDYSSVKFAKDGHYRYSILTPFFNNENPKSNYQFIMKYLSMPYKKLHDFLFENMDGVIASDIDYHLPLLEQEKYLGMVPNPVQIAALKYKPLDIEGKIHIFHGINSTNYIKKGNRFFEEALEIIQKKYPEKIEITSTKDMPYSVYINAYNKCHILLDQIYSYDQGYNALEAMAKGKVVLTGAEKEWLDYFGLENDTVAINAIPDTTQIVKKLEWLLLNPDMIQKISTNARAFVLKEHDHLASAKKYLSLWQNEEKV